MMSSGTVSRTDREVFRSVLRDYVSERIPLSHARSAHDGDRSVDRSVWKGLAVNLGVSGLTIPEELGGSGFTHAEAAVVFEELGRSLAPVPSLSCVGLACEVLLASGAHDAMSCLLPGIASGELLVSVALADEGCGMTEDAVTSVAERKDGTWYLRGRKHLVLDAENADYILVAARSDLGMSLFVVDPTSSRMSVEPAYGIDPTRRLSTVLLDGTEGSLIGTEGAAWPWLSRGFDVACLYLAAEAMGAAHYLVERSVAYAMERIQFGRRIGEFQAIQHLCADMYVKLELGRSALWAGLTSLSAHSPLSLPVHASIAKATCVDAFAGIAAVTVQVHGGLGFTWEHFAHLYLKRAKGDQYLLGSSAEHRQRISSAIL
jgi:alkylation response protein AidB-like acyl-CoA dehydrogenase